MKLKKKLLHCGFAGIAAQWKCGTTGTMPSNQKERRVEDKADEKAWGTGSSVRGGATI